MNDLKNKLEKLYQLVLVFTDSKANFIQALNNYLNFVKKENIFKAIIFTMKEDSAKESIHIISKTIHNKDARDYYQDKLNEDIDNEYPESEYNNLVQFCESQKNKLNISTKLSSEITTAYLGFLETLHKFFLKKLDWVLTHGVYSKLLDYDEEDGILFFQRKEIKINLKKVPTNAHYLLSYLLKNNPFEKHFKGELDDDKVLLEEKNWKRYYDACEDIQMKVEKETGVKDFLDFSSGQEMYVCINSKHSLTPKV